MTIQEAIKSGKPFRRKVWKRKYPNFWNEAIPKRKQKSKEVEAHKLSISDILATDWEVKP